MTRHLVALRRLSSGLLARAAAALAALAAALLVLLPGVVSFAALRAGGERVSRGDLPLLEAALVAGGLGAGAALAWRAEARWRRAQARRKRAHLERGASDHGADRTIEGALVLLRPQGDEENRELSTWVPDALAHFPVAGRPCELSPTVEAALETDEGRVVLDGPLLVALGSDVRRGRERGRAGEWCSVREGDRVLARGVLVDEPAESGRGSPFRETARRLRLLPSQRGSGGALVVPLLCLHRPRFSLRWRQAALRATLPALAAAAGVAAGHPRASAASGAACVEAAMEALEASDPWAALSHLERCPVPLLEGRARWMVGDFAGASEAFARAAPHEPTVSEVEAHALGGHLGRAAEATRLMARAWGLPSTSLVRDLDCIADAFEARGPGGHEAARRLDRAEGTHCRVLARDVRITQGLGDPADPALRPVPSGQTTLDALLALLPLTDPLRPQRFDGDLPSIDFGGAGRDPRARHRHRPLALHADILAHLRGDGRANHARLPGARAQLAAALATDLALLEAYAGRRELAADHLDLVRAFVDPRHTAGLRDDGAVGLYSRDREMALCAAWASHHAGYHAGALALARAASDAQGSALLARSIQFATGQGPFAPGPWLQDEPWSPAGRLFELGSQGDARPVVDWLRAHHHDGRGVLDRLAPRLTKHTDELRRFVDRYPTRCWGCGLGALIEHTADRRALARTLGLVDLEERLGLVADRAVTARLGRELAVPLLLLEQYRDY